MHALIKVALAVVSFLLAAASWAGIFVFFFAVFGKENYVATNATYGVLPILFLTKVLYDSVSLPESVQRAGTLAKAAVSLLLASTIWAVGFSCSFIHGPARTLCTMGTSFCLLPLCSCYRPSSWPSPSTTQSEGVCLGRRTVNDHNERRARGKLKPLTERATRAAPIAAGEVGEHEGGARYPRSSQRQGSPPGRDDRH